MNATNSDLWTLVLGIFTLLVVSSAIGYLLQRRLPAGKSNAAIENLNARITAWWIMVILIGLAFLAGRIGVLLLFGFCSFAALREFITLTDTKRADHWALAAAFFVVLPIQYWLLWEKQYGIFSIFIPVYAFLLMPIISVLRGDTERFLIRIAEVQWALMICVFCASHVPALLTLTIPGYEGRNVLLIAFLVIIVQLSDVLQYVWGKLLGRTKIAPSLSPSKTVEGFVGGVVSATLIGAALWWITPFTPFQAGVLAFVITMMGFFGGLVMSAIKRDRGVKDWGHLIEGHGGLIDRLDSVVFSAPIFFHIVRYWWSTT
ncbi:MULTISPECIES: phosphatidate cytidylyltransferase [Rhizobium]|uniref:Phosphatidate cytidylyltransferase n=1 Tax=Rhizobium favelukesii TaxID=348824 RepID=W6RLG1_9HYPH|nr:MULTISPECIES: phosphatidate cytidylyltransferase [Rhizobium]MCA0803803.1 phosphatidate cytidylyltransferase [Rhizobium sp. T1473]MCS0457126.1 phosphatidate cytidylyltransferase [Rhizobium favelukesii]UFS82638.1 phosphatidate cytidylyltransferase [Rhizobium sp. T136]CDM59788.1 phosphatidate cytidylyltransferase [Rhizobium favelukesii]